MREPPSVVGSRQESSIREVPSASASRLRGAPGTVASVVARAVFENGPVPAVLIAATR